MRFDNEMLLPQMKPNKRSRNTAPDYVLVIPVLFLLFDEKYQTEKANGIIKTEPQIGRKGFLPSGVLVSAEAGGVVGRGVGVCVEDGVVLGRGWVAVGMGGSSWVSVTVEVGDGARVGVAVNQLKTY